MFFDSERNLYFTSAWARPKHSIWFDHPTKKSKISTIINHKSFFEYNLAHQSHLYKQNTSTYLCFHIKNLSFKKHSTPSLSGLYFTLHIRSNFVFFLIPSCAQLSGFPFEGSPVEGEGNGEVLSFLQLPGQLLDSDLNLGRKGCFLNPWTFFKTTRSKT